MSTNRIILPLRSKGFTVVELMIAIAIFGLVLLFVATAIMQVSRLYYRNLTETKVQNTNRELVDGISRAIQFNGGTVTDTPPGAVGGSATYTFCIGNQQYSYKLGQQLVEGTAGVNQSRRVLVVRTLSGCTSSSLPPSMTNPAAAGREILTPKMRIAKLEVKSAGSDYYTIKSRIVYGDPDLLNNPTADNATCRNITSGTQFCAVSDITAAVAKRVK